MGWGRLQAEFRERQLVLSLLLDSVWLVYWLCVRFRNLLISGSLIKGLVCVLWNWCPHLGKEGWNLPVLPCGCLSSYGLLWWYDIRCVIGARASLLTQAVMSMSSLWRIHIACTISCAEVHLENVCLCSSLAALHAAGLWCSPSELNWNWCPSYVVGHSFNWPERNTWSHRNIHTCPQWGEKVSLSGKPNFKHNFLGIGPFTGVLVIGWWRGLWN